jgi:hypothetical protein
LSVVSDIVTAPNIQVLKRKPLKTRIKGKPQRQLEAK